MAFSFIVIAFGAGIALAVQAAINSQLSVAVANQPLLAAAISFSTGAITLLLLCWWKADLIGALQHLPKQPFWKFLGGPLGALAVFTTVFLAPKIGVSNMLFFIIIGQLVAALIIDHFGLMGMPIRAVNGWKIFGFMVILLGLGIFFFAEKLFIAD